MEATATEPTADRRQPAGGTIALALAPGVALLTIGTVLAVDEGGFAATTWYPAALIVLALTAVVVVATKPRPSEAWLGVRGALAAFAGYVAWSYLSILWADVPANAWDGGNRSLLYLLVFALVTLRPWSAKAGRIGLGAVVVAIAGLAVGELIVMIARSDPSSLFLNGRLSSPTAYPNATATLWLMGAVPALWLSCDRALHPLLRGAFAAIATMLIELALMSQSRGSALALIVGAAVLLALAPRRWPALIALVGALAATALSWSSLVAVHAAAQADLAQKLHDAESAIAISAVVVAILGSLAAYLDRGLAHRLGPNATRNGNRALLGLLCVTVAAALVAIGNPVSWVDARWHDFKSNGELSGSQNRFSGSLGSQRYDFYRVGINDFRDQPIQGIGVDSFGPSYLVHGRSDETPHYAHSIAIGLLAETGVVGTALFLAFLLLAGRAAVRAVRSRRSVAALGGLLGCTVFLGGSLVDWLWQFPGLGILAFMLLGIAVVSEAPERSKVLDLRHTTGGGVRRAAAIVGAVVAALSLALPAAAARFTSSAYDLSATSPAAAVHRLDRAAALNPLSSDPLLARAIIQRRLGDLAGSIRSLGEAIAREDTNWFAYFERGMVESRRGLWAAADADIARALALNPRQPVVDAVRRTIAARRPADPDEAERALTAQLDARLQPLG